MFVFKLYRQHYSSPGQGQLTVFRFYWEHYYDANGGDALYIGASATQRIGFWNTSFRGNLSVAENDDNAAVSTGGLMFAEISTTPKGTDTVAYGNFFWAIDEFASAARDATAGGPLGYPWLLDPSRRQLVVEAGGRKRASSEIDAAAIGGRFQQAIGRRLILRVDAFASVQEDRDEGFGVRGELQVRF